MASFQIHHSYYLWKPRLRLQTLDFLLLHYPVHLPLSLPEYHQYNLLLHHPVYHTLPHPHPALNMNNYPPYRQKHLHPDTVILLSNNHPVSPELIVQASHCQQIYHPNTNLLTNHHCHQQLPVLYLQASSCYQAHIYLLNIHLFFHGQLQFHVYLSLALAGHHQL